MAQGAALTAALSAWPVPDATHKLSQRSKSVKFNVKSQPARKLFASASNPSFRPTTPFITDPITPVRFVTPARSPSTNRAHFKRHSLRDNDPPKDIAVKEAFSTTTASHGKHQQESSPLDFGIGRPKSPSEGGLSSTRQKYIARARSISHYIKERTRTLFLRIVKRSQKLEYVPVQHVEAQHAPLFVDRTRESTGPYKRLSTGLMSPQGSEDMPIFTQQPTLQPVKIPVHFTPCDILPHQRVTSGSSGVTSWNDDSIHASRITLQEKEYEKHQLDIPDDFEKQRLSIINESSGEQSVLSSTFQPISSVALYDVLKKRLDENSPEVKLAQLRAQPGLSSEESAGTNASTESFVGTEAQKKIRVPPRSTSVDGLRATVRRVTSKLDTSTETVVHSTIAHNGAMVSDGDRNINTPEHNHHLSLKFESSISSPLDPVVSHTTAHQTTYANIRSTLTDPDDEEDITAEVNHTVVNKQHTKSSNSMKSLLGSRRETGSGLFGSSHMVIERTQSPYRKALAEFDGKSPIIPPRRHTPGPCINSDELDDIKYGGSAHLTKVISPTAPGEEPIVVDPYAESVYSRSGGALTPGRPEEMENEAGMFPIRLGDRHCEVNHGSAIIVGSTTYSPKKRAFESTLKKFVGGRASELTEKPTAINDSADWKRWIGSELAALERNKSLEMTRAASEIALGAISPDSNMPGAFPEAIIEPTKPEEAAGKDTTSPLERNKTANQSIPGFVTPTRSGRKGVVESQASNSPSPIISKGRVRNADRDRDSPGRRLANTWLEKKKRMKNMASANGVDGTIDSSDASVFL